MSDKENISQKVNHLQVHMNEGNLLPENQECFFCGNQVRKAVYKLQDNPRVELCECTLCKASSASRMPTEETLWKYYQDYYPKDEMKSNNMVTFKQVDRFTKHLFKYISPLFNSTNAICILDYGGGDGSVAICLAKKLIDHGLVKQVEIIVLDYVEMLATTQPEINIKRVDPGTPLTNNHFDIIIASAIIEHIPQAGDVIRQLFSALKVGGFFYARTPWALPLARFSKIFGKQWNFFFPAHVHDLGKFFWEHTAKKSSFNLSIIRSSPSIVETSFKTKPIITTVAYLFKMPWFLFPTKYKLVGGWEVILTKK